MTAPHSAELGQTSDPRALVPGDPGSIEADVDLLRTRSPTMEDVGTGLRRVDAPSWTGPASAAFHNDLDPQAARWFGVATIMTDAAAALASYASTLRSSQSLAQDAIDLWAQGEAETARAKFAYDQEQNRTYITAPGAPVPQPDHCAVFVDTGEPLREQARETLTRARTQLQAAGDEAARTLARLAGLPDPLAAKDEKDDGGWETESDWLFGEHKEEGPRFSGTGADHKLGDAPWDKEWGSAGKPGWAQSLGELSGAVGVWKGEAAYEHTYGDLSVDATAEAELATLEGKLAGKVTDDGFTGEARAAVVLAKGSVEGSADYGVAHAEGKVEAAVEAEAEGEAELGKHGVHASGEVFAGGKASAEAKGDLGGIGGGVKAEGWYGIGASGGGDLTFTDGTFTVKEHLGLALGLGGNVGGEVTLDFPKMWRTGSEAVESLGGLFD